MSAIQLFDKNGELRFDGTSVQTLLLGPYTVNFDEAGIGVGTITLDTLDAGQMVVNAWFFPTTAWNHDGGAPTASYFYISVSVTGGGVNVAGYDLVVTSLAGGEPELSGDAGSAIQKRVARSEEGSVLGFEAYPGAGSFTAGVAEVYVLLAAG